MTDCARSDWIPLPAMKSHPLGIIAAVVTLALSNAIAAPLTDAEKIAAVEQKATATIIPKLEFREVTAAEALATIAKLSDVKISYVPNPDDPAKLTVSLTKIPVSEALKYVTGLANLKFAYEKDGVRVLPMDAVAK